jgi:hypothetical protein
VECLVMMTFTDLTSVPADRPTPFTGRLHLAAAAYPARFTGPSRQHTVSDLRCYLSWCAERGLDPLAAPSASGVVHPMDAREPPLQALHGVAEVLGDGRVLPTCFRLLDAVLRARILAEPQFRSGRRHSPRICPGSGVSGAHSYRGGRQAGVREVDGPGGSWPSPDRSRSVSVNGRADGWRSASMNSASVMASSARIHRGAGASGTITERAALSQIADKHSGLILRNRSSHSWF